MKFLIDSYIKEKRAVVDKKLETIFRKNKKKLSVLNDSIRYSLLAKGKRLRPVLCLASCETFNGSLSQALPVACALEMIHTYSLIHDDLPSMDNDNLRRGVPTNHNVFGESTAILAGDALLTDSFNVIVSEGNKTKLSPETICKIVELISNAAGSKGMVEGQAIDLAFDTKKNISEDDLKNLHSLKTGSLISASVISGALVAGAEVDDIKNLKKFSDAIGLAFQIKDDLIDEDVSRRIGKSGGSDKKNKKSTYLTILGRKKSMALIDDLTKKSINSLNKINKDTTLLKNLAGYLGERKR